MYIDSNLKYLREVREISRTKMAVAIGVKVSVIRNIETGKTKNPTIGTVTKLCNYLEIPLDHLVNRDLSWLLSLPLFGTVPKERCQTSPYQKSKIYLKDNLRLISSIKGISRTKMAEATGIKESVI